MLYKIPLESSKKQELVDVTDKLIEAVASSKVKEGTMTVFLAHASAAIICNENADPNIEKDFWKAIEKAIPLRNNYLHDEIDSNAAAHIRSAVIGPDITFIIEDGKIILGTWQNVMVAELDGPKRRVLYAKIIQG